MAHDSVAFAMLTIIRQTAKVSHSGYCDDFTKAGSKPHVLNNQLIVRDNFESTFGPKIEYREFDSYCSNIRLLASACVHIARCPLPLVKPGS